MNRLTNAFYKAKGNRWHYLFSLFCRIALAISFIISGFVKISGERFASGLPVNNPMGHYLEALHHTEYYYTFIGISQVIIAILLLIPRTAFLGALMYFPIIFNICILAHAVRFEGTRITTFMVLASLYLILWDYDKLQHILPFKKIKEHEPIGKNNPFSNKFPFLFFGGVFATLITIVVINMYIYDIRPGNSQEECVNGCPGNNNPEACTTFCDCIYNRGNTLHVCLEVYEQSRTLENP